MPIQLTAVWAKLLHWHLENVQHKWLVQHLLCITTPIPKGPDTPDCLMASSCSKRWPMGLLFTYCLSKDDAALLNGGAMVKPEWLAAGGPRQLLLYWLSWACTTCCGLLYSAARRSQRPQFGSNAAVWSKSGMMAPGKTLSGMAHHTEIQSHGIFLSAACGV